MLSNRSDVVGNKYNERLRRALSSLRVVTGGVGDNVDDGIVPTSLSRGQNGTEGRTSWSMNDPLVSLMTELFLALDSRCVTFGVAEHMWFVARLRSGHCNVQYEVVEEPDLTRSVLLWILSVAMTTATATATTDIVSDVHVVLCKGVLSAYSG